MTRSRKTLAEDLAALLAKHPLDEWRALLAQLRDDKLRDDVVSAVESLMPLARTSSAPKSDRTRSEGVGALLRDIRAKDPQKADHLANLYERLRDRTILPGSRDVRQFAEALGMKERLPGRREQALTALMRYLASLPIERLTSGITTSPGAAAARDLRAEYERWVRIILGRVPSG